MKSSLIRFKLGLLDRVKRELPKLHPVAQKAADVDITFIETQMARYYERLDLWYQRVWKLQGLWLDPDGRVLRHNEKEAVLTNREFELLQFLPDHPPSLLHLVADHWIRLVGLRIVSIGSAQLCLASKEDPRSIGDSV